MPDYKFYLTYRDRLSLEDAHGPYHGLHAGNIIATEGDFHGRHTGISLTAWAPNSNKPNSSVVRVEIPVDYLMEYCRPVSEEVARWIHPALFEVIDMEDAETEEDW